MDKSRTNKALDKAETSPAQTAPLAREQGLTANEPVIDTFPDGSWTAWSVVLGGWCAMFVSVGWNNSVGILQTIYETDRLREYSPSTIGWINSVQTCFMFVCAPIFGRIFDTDGPRYALFFGTLLNILGVMMMSLSTQYWHFILSQSVCTGIGAGAIFFSASNTIATWFKRRRALALGIASSGSAVGGTVIPIVIDHVYHKSGFGWALRSTGFIFAGLLVVTNIAVRSRLRPSPKPFRLQNHTDPLFEARYLFLTIGCFMFAMAVYQPGTFIILNARNVGVNTKLSAYLLAMLNASSVIGRIMAGWLADTIGRFNCMILTTALSAIFVLAVWIPATSAPPLIMFAILVGFTNGAYVALVSALVAQISDMKEIGTRNGTNWLIYGVGALIGTPIAGALIERDDGGFLYMKIFSGVAMLVSAALMVGSRTVQVGWKWTWI